MAYETKEYQDLATVFTWTSPKGGQYTALGLFMPYIQAIWNYEDFAVAHAAKLQAEGKAVEGLPVKFGPQNKNETLTYKAWTAFKSSNKGKLKDTLTVVINPAAPVAGAASEASAKLLGGFAAIPWQQVKAWLDADLQAAWGGFTGTGAAAFAEYHGDVPDVAAGGKTVVKALPPKKAAPGGGGGNVAKAGGGLAILALVLGAAWAAKRGA